MSLSSKVAIITGGSGTIGKAIAHKFLEEGAVVVLTGRKEAALRAAKEELVQVHARYCIVLKVCNVTDEQSVVDMFAELDEEKMVPHILVNNAGTASNDATETMSGAEFERVYRTNVLGPFLCARECLKRMIPGSKIINIGSLSATAPRPNSIAYTSSKFALKGMTKSLSLDARAKGIAVGTISPGNVISNLLDEATIAERQEGEGFIQPQDVAQCVLTMATMPAHANILELTVLPTRQPLVGRG